MLAGASEAICQALPDELLLYVLAHGTPFDVLLAEMSLKRARRYV